MKNTKTDLTTKIYKEIFDVKENHFNVNREVKAVIINFGDERGDIIVKNDNFGTRRKCADFTNGKKKLDCTRCRLCSPASILQRSAMIATSTKTATFASLGRCDNGKDRTAQHPNFTGIKSAVAKSR